MTPIIHIIGLPGAGKTTLGDKLAKELGLPIYRIGKYRTEYPETFIGEADAWVALFRDLSMQKWSNCILETTGMNCRESFLRGAMPPLQMVTIKLEAQRKVLYERIKKKNKNEQGGEWTFSKDFKDKREFVRKMFKGFKDIPAEIRVNTSKLGVGEVCQEVVGELRVFYDF